MTNQEIAAKKFQDRQGEIWTLDRFGIGNEQEINTRYGYRHGRIVVGGESFSREMATGEKYDMNQGGWAWV